MGDYDVDDVNQVNEAAESLLADHVLQIEAVKNNQRNTDTLPIWDAILNRTISITEEHDIGLATGQGIQWGGGAPYNAFCPRDTHHPNFDGAGNYEHSRVGCVATAVAQILNYYKQWNYSFSESDRYLSQKDGFNCEIDTDAIQYDFPDFDSLNLLLSDVIGSFNNDATLTDTDKAALSFACGILVKMRYSSNGSGAGSSNIAYDKLNIYCESVSRADTVMFPNDEAWINMVNSQLRLNRPIEYRGYPYGGIGHAYIITGFQTTSMNTTLNLVNWGRPWCHPEYWSLQPTNSACPYPFHHEMLIGIAPKCSVVQTIQLDNGGIDYSGIHLSVVGHCGISITFTCNDGVFEFGLPPGTYNFEIYDENHYYDSVYFCDINIQSGINYISPDPIVMPLKPNVVTVYPDDEQTIQGAIDSVRNGGTVAIQNGHYTVSELKWQNKHVKLCGQSQSGVTITNNYSNAQPAIRLNWHGINHQDVISNITFLGCDLTGDSAKKGAAIVLDDGAAPIVTNCTFSQNRVGNSGTVSLLTGVGTGGAVYIGNYRRPQVERPVFTNCTFDNNYTLNGKGGGAVSLYGVAMFTECTFTNNETIIADGSNNTQNNDMGGAVIVYLKQAPGDISFNHCIFSNNRGKEEADDVFVVCADSTNTIQFNCCTFKATTPHFNGAKPAIKFSTLDDGFPESTGAHLILTNNKFLSCRKGALHFCDRNAQNRLTFTGNVVANNIYDGYGVYSCYPDASSPEGSSYLNFSNNTFSGILGSGLILYQGPHTTITNTVFENCSSYGISWNSHEENHPEWATRGLTVSHSLFSMSTPRYDFSGDSNRPLIEDAVLSLPEMHLGYNYVPIWTASTMSPCIDAGIGTPDNDGTPPDIGARGVMRHKYWNYTFESPDEVERWYWVSYPVLNTITDNALVASEFFNELLPVYETTVDGAIVYRPVYLEEIRWYEEGDEYNIIWDEDAEVWTENINSHIVSSPQGYKIKLVERVYSEADLPISVTESGFKTQDSTQFPIYGGVENWLGYFKEEAALPHNAFSAIWDDITRVCAKNWCLQRNPKTGMMEGVFGYLQYGDLVIVNTNNNHTFQWSENLPPEIPRIKGEPEHFVFDEKADYIPVYISIPDSLVATVSEVGIYIDGTCKGAVVVEENYEQLSTYVDSAAELQNSEVQFVFYCDEGKGLGTQLKPLNLDNARLQVKHGAAGYPFFEINLSWENMEYLAPPAFALKQNYPNPFNPSTTITYSLPKASRVRLDVFNVKGQHIKTLVNSELFAGVHKVVWDGKDVNNNAVSSGVYFYRISSPQGSISKKMLLIK